MAAFDPFKDAPPPRRTPLPHVLVTGADTSPSARFTVFDAVSM
jgi:hypothetical protein